jgi:hypothetical protein
MLFRYSWPYLCTKSRITSRTLPRTLVTMYTRGCRASTYCVRRVSFSKKSADTWVSNRLIFCQQETGSSTGHSLLEHLQPIQIKPAFKVFFRSRDLDERVIGIDVFGTEPIARRSPLPKLVLILGC